MTQEDKELLLKDLCTRLPYGLKVKCEKYPLPVTVLYAGNIDEVKFRETGGIENIYTIKPYLLPLESMTEEQRREYDKIIYHSIELHHREYSDIVEIDLFDNLQDFYCKNHLDYRGLIPMGLALDATGKNIY